MHSTSPSYLHSIVIISSLFLLLFLLLGHLDEGVLEHGHPRDQSGELLIILLLPTRLVGDALGNPIGTHTDLILSKHFLHSHHLLLRLTNYPLLCLFQDLLECLLFGRTCMTSQRGTDDVKFRRDG